MSNYHLTIKSANAKTGPIPVTTSTRDNCPPDCGQARICYADTGPLALHWAAVTAGARGTSWADHVAQLAQLPDGQLWRANQAGDLPRAPDRATIDPVKLGQLVKANQGKRGFTYSHWKDAESISWIRHANQWGFTVNLSADSLAEADQLADHQAGPVVVVLPADQAENLRTPAGRLVVICPATQRDDVSCASCQLCQRQRTTIVGFPAHGTRRNQYRTIPLMAAISD